MSSPVLEIPTGKQFLQIVLRWMKKNKVGSRELAEISGTSTGTLYKLIANPDTITMATIIKYQKAMKSYRASGASRPSSSPARSASKRAAQ